VGNGTIYMIYIIRRLGFGRRGVHSCGYGLGIGDRERIDIYMNTRTSGLK
jgi:hypothetical protein